VLTTLFSNLLVPGLYVFRELDIDPRAFMIRTLSAPLSGAVLLLAATSVLQLVLPESPVRNESWLRLFVLFVHLLVGSLAYVGGYVLMPIGRRDLFEIAGRLKQR
jgi:hypothetical protein